MRSSWVTPCPGGGQTLQEQRMSTGPYSPFSRLLSGCCSSGPSGASEMHAAFWEHPWVYLLSIKVHHNSISISRAHTSSDYHIFHNSCQLHDLKQMQITDHSLQPLCNHPRELNDHGWCFDSSPGEEAQKHPAALVFCSLEEFSHEPNLHLGTFSVLKLSWKWYAMLPAAFSFSVYIQCSSCTLLTTFPWKDLWEVF